jgi:hypothetical protein
MSTESAPRRSILKLGLDILLAVTFALLLNAHVLGGLAFHETAGTLIGAAFALHVFLNWDWVVTTTRRFSQSALPPKLRIGFLLNWLLFLVMGLIILSGLLISRELVPGLRVPNGRWIQRVHITIAFLILGFVGVHVGLHWGWILGTGRRWFGTVGSTPWYRRPLTVGALLILLAAIGVLSFRGPDHPATETPELRVRAERPDFETDPRHVGPDGPSAGKGPAERRDDRAASEPRRGRGRRFGKPSVGGVLGFYLGILACFALATVLWERRLARRHTNSVATAPID